MRTLRDCACESSWPPAEQAACPLFCARAPLAGRSLFGRARNARANGLRNFGCRAQSRRFICDGSARRQEVEGWAMVRLAPVYTPAGDSVLHALERSFVGL